MLWLTDDRVTARVSYALCWGALAVALAYRRDKHPDGSWTAQLSPPFAAAVLACIYAVVGIWSGDDAAYAVGMLFVRGCALAACVGIVSRATTRLAFAAAVGLTGGHALSLLSFLISRLGPILSPDLGSQLAMRYGPWASAVEGLGCILIMTLALTWARAAPQR